MEGFSERLWYALARPTTSLHIGPVLTNLMFKRQPGYARTHVHSNCKSSWSWYSPIEFRGENAFSEAPVCSFPLSRFHSIMHPPTTRIRNFQHYGISGVTTGKRCGARSCLPMLSRRM